MAITGSSAAYLEQPPATYIGPNFYPPGTMSCWLYIPSTLGSATNYIMYIGIIAPNPAGAINAALHFTSGVGNRQLGCNFAVFSWGASYDLAGVSIVPDNQWMNIVVTADNAGTPGDIGTVAIYVNGVSYVSATIPGAWPNTGFVSGNSGNPILSAGFGGVGGAYLAYPAYWNIQFSAGQISAISTLGTLPTSVASANLKMFAPLQSGSLLNDYVLGANYYANTGSMTYVSDPFPYSQTGGASAASVYSFWGAGHT